MLQITKEINDILDVGYALSNEKYFLKLFDTVLNSCMKFTNSDASTIYFIDNLKIKSIIHINNTLEQRGIKYGPPEELIDITAHNIVSYAATHKEILRIDDVAGEKNFEVLKLREYDAAYGYNTQSLMLVPIFEPGKKVIGVVELINCTDDNGYVIPFPEEYAKLVNSLTSQMAIALDNLEQIEKADELLDSFVESMTTAIDARTPYNANHTRNVAQYCMEVVDEINTLHTKDEFDIYINENERQQLFMAAMLHDMGKMVTPREVLNKSTRLGIKYDSLMNKLEKITLMMKIDMLEGVMDKAEWAMEDLRLSNFRAELPGINIRERLNDSELYRINEMAKKVYTARDGTVIPYLDEEECKALNIVKGTLTVEEREIVQEHVVFTDKMLAEIKFNKKYNKVRTIAVNHHEYLDGSGYPNHLTAENLDILTRILTIIDIYDSLTAEDRPYKGTLPVHKALEILDSMAQEGKLDKDLVKITHNLMRRKAYGR